MGAIGGAHEGRGGVPTVDWRVCGWAVLKGRSLTEKKNYSLRTALVSTPNTPLNISLWKLPSGWKTIDTMNLKPIGKGPKRVNSLRTPEEAPLHRFLAAVRPKFDNWSVRVALKRSIPMMPTTLSLGSLSKWILNSCTNGRPLHASACC